MKQFDAQEKRIDRGVGTLIEFESPDAPVDDAFILAQLAKHGAVLLRNAVRSHEDFIKLSDRFSTDYSTYRGGGFRWGALDRQQIGDNATLLTTTGGTQGFALPLHGEMYYMKERPSLIWFYCEQPPSAGGQTTLADGIAIFERLTDSTRRFLLDTPVKYVRHLEDGDWQKTFQTDDVESIKAFCRQNDTTAVFDDANHSFSAEFVCPAVITDDNGATGVFINNMITLISAEIAFERGWVAANIPGVTLRASPLIVRTADGERIPEQVVKDIVHTAESLTAEIAWEPRDIVLVDNTWILHGRRQDTGTGRKIYVRMGEPNFPFQPHGRARDLNASAIA